MTVTVPSSSVMRARPARMITDSSSGRSSTVHPPGVHSHRPVSTFCHVLSTQPRVMGLPESAPGLSPQSSKPSKRDLQVDATIAGWFIKPPSVSDTGSVEAGLQSRA